MRKQHSHIFVDRVASEKEKEDNGQDTAVAVR